MSGAFVIPASEEPDPGLTLAEKLAPCFIPCTELGNVGIPPRRKLCGDWLFEGDLGFIFAPRGLGKTWFALSLATALSNGQSFGPWCVPTSQRVLYVDGEMPCHSIQERTSKMRAGENLIILNHEILFHKSGLALNLADQETQNALTECLQAEKVQVLFLDNLSCLFSGVAENEADAWEKVLNWLLALRRLRITVVIVHHSGRNPQNMRGTSKREDAAFWVIRLDAVEAEEREGARFVSRFTKDRNSQAEQTPLEWSFKTDNAGLKISHKNASNLEILLQWVRDGLSGAEEIAKEMVVSKGTVSKWAQKLAEAGKLKIENRRYRLVS
jgi:RecA-family ATPase